MSPFLYERVERPLTHSESKYPIDEILKTSEQGDALVLDVNAERRPTVYRLLAYHLRRRGFCLRSRVVQGKWHVWAIRRDGVTR